MLRWMDGWDHGEGTVRDRRQQLTSDEKHLYHDKVEKTSRCIIMYFQRPSFPARAHTRPNRIVVVVSLSPMSTNPFTPSNAPARASPMPNSFVT